MRDGRGVLYGLTSCLGVFKALWELIDIASYLVSG